MRTHSLTGVLVAVLFANVALAQEEEAPGVRLATAELREMAPTIPVPATVASRHDSDIASESSGRITFIADAGDVVEAGAPVAIIDDADARLLLQEAEARVSRLEVSLAQQTRDVERRRELASRGTLAESELDQVVSGREMTALELREARTAAERAGVELERTTVDAPFTGLVVERLVEVGEYATPGADVARLVDVDELEARGRAPVSVASYIRQGEHVEVTGPDGRTIQAPVRAVIAAGDAATRTFELRVDLSDSDWIIGAPVRLQLPSDVTRETVTVPRDAILLRSGGAFVMRVDEDNVAHRVDVEPGASEHEWVEVGDVLQPGDQVIIRGAERLRDGQTVEPLEAAAETVETAKATDIERG